MHSERIRGKGRRRRLLGLVLALLALPSPELAWSADLSVDVSLRS